jgi:hypothetical protein
MTNVQAIEAALREIAMLPAPPDCSLLGFNLNDLLHSGSLCHFLALRLAERGLLAVNELTEEQRRWLWHHGTQYVEGEDRLNYAQPDLDGLLAALQAYAQDRWL